ncbi:MAG: hypothetical protein FWH36_04330 [Lentimicrobiaceae bacterium]|nr:hypothetical protein [Lentimicrobiaceae bacterium]
MKNLSFFSRKVSFDAHNLVFVPKQRRRLSAFIRVCAVFAGLFFACLQFANAQPPFALHYWLNVEGVNYTLSPPTSRGEWILAATRGEKDPNGVVSGWKNNIVVFRLDGLDYEILPGSSTIPCSEDVSVVGLLLEEEDDEGEVVQKLDPNVDFIVHSVVECCNPKEYYVLCGSMRQPSPDGEIGTGTPMGMVVVLDPDLNVVHLRQYEDVSVFYSVYARDNFYYVCGQMQNGTGVVLRDSLLGHRAPSASSMAFQTFFPWAFHKITVRDVPCSGDYQEFSVSGTNGSEIGWAVVVTHAGLLSRSRYEVFHPGFVIDSNSKVAITYYSPSSTPGLLLSASDGNEIRTFEIPHNQQQAINEFKMPWAGGVLEDMACGGNDYEIAWVGNVKGTGTNPQWTADYIHTNMSSFTSASIISFTPYSFAPDHSAYYSLHKVHYFPGSLPRGNNKFHAGGYYRNYSPSYASDHPYDRTTFVVTPDVVVDEDEDDFPCASKRDEKIDATRSFQSVPAPSMDLYIEGIEPDGIRQLYKFCTMDCAGKRDDNCGNQRTDDPKANRKKK